MADNIFDGYEAAPRRRPQLSPVVVDKDTDPPAGAFEQEEGVSRDEATTEAIVVAGVGLGAALAFAIVGFTTVAMLRLAPAHWVAGLTFSGFFALLATAAGLIAGSQLRHLHTRRRREHAGVGTERREPAEARRRRRPTAAG